MQRISPIRRSLLARIAAICLLAVATTARAEDATADRAAFDARFVKQLAQLADKCDELGLAEQARTTRGWIIPRASDRRYLFLAGESDPTKPADDAPKLVRFWHAKFTEHRKTQAASLFELAQKELAAHRPASAYALVHEVLREDPDHAQARNIAGYSLVKGRWRQPGLVEQVQPVRIQHPKLGWAAGKYWRIKTAHFEITTNHSPAAGREMGRRLEELYSVWRQLFVRYWTTETALSLRFRAKSTIRPPTRRFRVTLFRTRDEYVKQLSLAQPQIAMTSGYYLDAQQTVFFFWGNGSSEATWDHEATHQLFQETRRGTEGVGRAENFWIVEGVALYMESLQRHDGYCTVGGVESGRLQYARRNALCVEFYVPLAELVAMGQSKVQEDPRIRRMYSQFGGLTHFLMDADDGRFREPLVNYLLTVYQHRDRRDTLSRLAGKSYEELDAEYRKFLQVTDADLKAIPKSARIEKLALGATAVTDAGLLALPDLNELQWIDLTAANVTDAGAKKLAQATSLISLTLQHTKITDAALSVVGNLTTLEELDLSGTRVTDAGLAQISNLKKLQSLWLTGTALTDAGLGHLAPLKQLETLDVSKTSVTPAGYNALKKTLPSLKDDE